MAKAKKPAPSAAWPMPGSFNEDDEPAYVDDEGSESSIDFSCQEVTFATFKYTPAEFSKLKVKGALKEWIEELEHNSCSFPLYVGSPFDSDGENVPCSSDETPEDGVVYVVPHYFYETADYTVSGVLNSKSKIKIAEEIGSLIPGLPMSHAMNGKESVEFECQGTTDGTEYSVYVFWNGDLIAESELSDVTAEFIKTVLKIVQ